MPVPTVHPHACGEHRGRSFTVRSLRGSSPRVWGTSKPSGSVSRDQRFIPTRVGNMPRKINFRPIPAVHPHACGEHGNRDPLPLHPGGSSPRVWGTSLPGLTFCRKEPVHPHACGEHIYAGQFGLSASRFIPTRVGNMRPTDSISRRSNGSSPRVWGT